MKLTGPACAETLSGDEEVGRRERAGDNAGGVRVERRVRLDAAWTDIQELMKTSQSLCMDFIVNHRGLKLNK
jgi:hypothetical protein